MGVHRLGRISVEIVEDCFICVRVQFKIVFHGCLSGLRRIHLKMPLSVFMSRRRCKLCHFEERGLAIDHLCHAVGQNDIRCVDAQLQDGADVNEVNESQATPMFVAAKEGHLEMIRFLHSVGASVNGPDDALVIPPISIAAMNDGVAVIKLLVDLGADIHRTNNDGWTPLHHAAVGNGDALRLLLALGADPNGGRRLNVFGFALEISRPNTVFTATRFAACCEVLLP